MILIDYNGTNEAVAAAATQVNKLFTYIPFLEAIYKKEKFHLANTSPQKIVTMMHEANLRINVELYWPLPFAKNAYAYDDPLNPSIIHLNKRALNRPVHSLCNTLVHQCVHAVNAQNPTSYFGHGDNSPEHKEDTAPFWIAALAQKMVADENITFDSMPHEDVDNIPFIRNTSSKQIQKNMFNDGICCFYDMMQIMEN